MTRDVCENIRKIYEPLGHTEGVAGKGRGAAGYADSLKERAVCFTIIDIWVTSFDML